MQEQDIRVFGIRHHGAGSARRLIKALEDYGPDAICIEMPAESEHLFSSLADVDLESPVAFLCYQENNANRFFYLPMAEFSPEFQAIQYGLRKDIIMRAMDLPAAHALISENFKLKPEASLNLHELNITRDPLGYLARRQGYKDTERWWNSYFEQWTDHHQLFDVIQELMTELRKISKGLDDEETLIREQYMRKVIGETLNLGVKRIAIVCGAWHGPVLTMDAVKSKKAEKIKKLKAVPIKCALIPWSYERLILNRSYSAGIESPVWSEALFRNPDNAIAYWMSKAAELLRQYEFNVSTAEVIDAQRLADQLAGLRDLPLPGIDELMDAATTVFGQGSTSRLDIISQKLIVGHKTGYVPLTQESLPLVLEFKEKLHKLKLNPFWVANPKEQLDLDLRKEKHLEISRFLYQSKLLGVNWAHERMVESKSLGNFHEYWSFQWSPESEMELIKTALLGNSIEDCITGLLSQRLESERDLVILANSLEYSLKSGIHSFWPLLSDRLLMLSMDQQDVEILAKLVKPLIASLSYGSIYQIKLDILQELLSTLITKIILHFGEQTQRINDEKAQKMLGVFIMLHSYFYHDSIKDNLELWKEELHKMGLNEFIHPLISGKCWFTLIDEKWAEEKDYLLQLEYQCNHVIDPQHTAKWIEGFLHSANGFYFLKDEVLKILDQWLCQLPEEEFKLVLPLLRRSFSKLTDSEIIRIRSKILNPLKNKQDQMLQLLYDDERKKKVDQYYSLISEISSSSES
ncbi:MAG: hypothetical protein IPI30_16320 [Saprospiraceae bacterium]|nr:hypothetical protein [Candidatus Vicinibacter affinis]